MHRAQRVLFCLCLLGAAGLSAASAADEPAAPDHDHEVEVPADPIDEGAPAPPEPDAHDHHGHSRLHFAHPLVAESPTPDTKVRFEYIYARETEEEDANRHTLGLEAEYAFARWVSLEIGVPYTFLDPDEGSSESGFDTVELAVKLASFAFGEKGLVLGGGLELGLPTGDDAKGIGSDHIVEVEPFLNFGWRYRRLETIGFLKFGIPTNFEDDEEEEEEADLELGWNLSFLYYLTPRLEGLLEFDGEFVFGGEEDGVWIVNTTPGLKLALTESRRLKIGAGVSVPLTSDREFDVRPLLTVFYHF